MFAPANHGVATRPDADIRIADGRAFLLSDNEQYDVITLEPPPPIARGVANLYSKEFYELCRLHLRPGGMMAQWVPLTTQNLDATRMLMRTFQDVFPHTTLWTTEWHETMLLGSLDPLHVDVAAIAEQTAQPEIHDSLAEVGIADTARLFATFLMDEAALRAFTADADIVTDDRPRIEFATMPAAGDFVALLQALVDGTCRPDRPSRSVWDAAVAELKEMSKQRVALLHFYEASVAAQAGDTAAAAAALGRAVPNDPDNAYYHWSFRW